MNLNAGISAVEGWTNGQGRTGFRRMGPRERRLDDAAGFHFIAQWTRA